MSDDEPREHTHPTRQQGRAAAEWVTLAVSLAVILLFVGLATSQALVGGTRPVSLAVVPLLHEVRRGEAVFHLPVEVTNTGEETAENVRVKLSLQTGAEPPETAEFQIHFLAGGETQRSVVVFQANPIEAGLTVSPVSYQIPTGELGP